VNEKFVNRFFELNGSAHGTFFLYMERKAAFALKNDEANYFVIRLAGNDRLNKMSVVSLFCSYCSVCQKSKKSAVADFL